MKQRQCELEKAGERDGIIAVASEAKAPSTHAVPGEVQLVGIRLYSISCHDQWLSRVGVCKASNTDFSGRCVVGNRLPAPA